MEESSRSIHLGTQGWSYKSWVGTFLPAKTPAAKYLEEYARIFHAVEIDATYYGIPRSSTIESWDRATPTDFRFTAKFPQSITHEKMLKGVERETYGFLDAMSLLGGKLGPLLMQFPYNFKPTLRTELESFLAALPSDSHFRFAVEVRNKGWLQDWFFDLLAQHRVALTLADYAYMPKLERVTTDFTYIRWLGNRRDVPDDEYDHVRRNRDEEMDHWTDVIANLVDKGVAIWGFANNHYMGHSPATVRELMARLQHRGISI